MESKPEEEKEITQKHEKLDEAEIQNNVENVVEIVNNPHIKNTVSPFINQTKAWDDEEHFKIPEDLRTNIETNLKFEKPSNIQAVSIPLIVAQPPEHLIAQARNGCGKTGSFVIGSTLRVDRENPNPQVLCLANTRELTNQIHSVYERVTKGTGITLSNFSHTRDTSQIIVSLHTKIEELIKGRKPLNLSTIKCIVIDEADVFFSDERNFEIIKKIANSKDIANRPEDNPLQWVLFSATFPTESEQDLVQKNISEILPKANQVKIKQEKLNLKHIKQFHRRCEEKKKLDFIKEVFEVAEMTQTFIFVNTKDFAEKIHIWLRKSGFKSYIMFSKMSKDLRDATIEKFRKQEINVLITTNLIARGIDVPEVELVINYDVPSKSVQGKSQADPETYLHRIGRTGRFGRQGVAVSIYDRNRDKEFLDDIIKFYSMENSITELQGPDHLKEVLREINE